MTTLTHSDLVHPDLAHGAHPVRTALRSTGVLAVSLALTVGVLMAVASFVDTWA